MINIFYTKHFLHLLTLEHNAPSPHEENVFIAYYTYE